MPALALAALIAVLGGPAAAHEPGSAHSPSGPWTSAHWTLDPWVMLLLSSSIALYVHGTGRLWRRAGWGRGITPAHAVFFCSGWILLALALVSPLHWLGERLFAAHMLEHVVLVAIAAPLLALGWPNRAAAWGTPRPISTGVSRLLAQAHVARAWRVLTDPLVATAIHGAALWLLHVPRIFELALANLAVHRLQHLLFVLTAVLFWWSLLRSRKPGVAVFCLFVTTIHMSLLGLLLTLSARLWYPPQPLAAAFGLTPLEDQQLAGLVMWVPMGLVYTAAGLGFAANWIAASAPAALSRGPAADVGRRTGI